MAAIDKLYLREYDDLRELRLWALLYYPKLFLYFYDFALTIDYEKFKIHKEEEARKNKQRFIRQWKNFSPDGTLNGAVANLISTYNMSEDDANWNASYAYKDYNKSLTQIEKEVSIPVMNTPFRVDKILKWICPLPCVRTYLQINCGVREHWYYRLFWRGKKRFNY